MVAMETKVCHVINLWTSFQKKLDSKLLVLEEHAFQKGAQSAPLATGAKKSLAWLGKAWAPPSPRGIDISFH